MSNDTTQGSSQGKIYKPLNMKKKTRNTLIYKKTVATCNFLKVTFLWAQIHQLNII